MQRHPGGRRDLDPGGYLDSRSRIKYATRCVGMTTTLRTQYGDTLEYRTRTKAISAKEHPISVSLVPGLCSWPPPSGGRLEGGNRGMRCAPVSHCRRHRPPPRLPPLGGGIAWEHLFWKSPKSLTKA